MPAHNEALLLGACLDSFARMRRTHADATLMVLLDACTDASAAICTGRGARAVDFGHDAAVGKARLLSLAVDAGLTNAFDAVVIVDADTRIDEGFLDAVAARADLHDVAQQGVHGMANPSASWLTILGALLTTIRYEGQLPLRDRTELTVPLTGNGMCFGRNVVREHGLACRTIKEDLELYVRYTLAGVRIVLNRDARIYAQEASTLAGARTQRERWDAGKWHILARYGRQILTTPLSLRQRIDTMAEMTHHGPVVHAGVGLLLGLPLVLTPDLRQLLGVLLLVAPAALAAWTCWGLWRSGDRGRVLAAMTWLPVYMAWRITVSVIALARAPTLGWRRSPRE